MVKYLIISTILALMILGCKKPEDRSCFKSIGDQGVRDTTLTSFDTLELYDDIEYYIVPDSNWGIHIEGGENLLKHVGITNENSKLTVKNENKCNFLRKLNEKIKVY